MKRWAVTIILFLLLGAIVNIAVAWAFGFKRISEWKEKRGFFPPATWYCDWWRSRAGDHHSNRPRVIYEWSVLGRHDLRMDEGGDLTQFPPYYCYGLRSGFPSLSLEGVCWTDNSRVSQNGSAISSAEWLLLGSGGLQGDGRGLPLRPLWPGFAINTLFYAVILWLLFAAPFALRRWRRIKRGLCVKCGYDLRKQPSDSSVCPECGTPVR